MCERENEREAERVLTRVTRVSFMKKVAGKQRLGKETRELIIWVFKERMFWRKQPG